jgi:5-methyltetrahydropteroyltriglutamate--homocysteine methyltransferase
MQTYIIGFPRIGEERELKFVLERYWSGAAEFSEVEATAVLLRERHWRYQIDAGIDLISVNDFSLYDTTLDMMVALGLEPREYLDIADATERYFAMARGDASHKALEMTKWFNTNYHYIVPVLDRIVDRPIDPRKIVSEYAHAKATGVAHPKINLVGPLTFIANAKQADGKEAPFETFDTVLERYVQLLETLAELDERVIVQLDEPVLATDRAGELLLLLRRAYDRLGAIAPSLELYVVTYFDHAAEAVSVLVHTPVCGIGLDWVYGHEENRKTLETIARSDKKLIAGIIDGRNVWVGDLEAKRREIEQMIATIDRDRLILSTSCSLLHVPYTLRYEDTLEEEVRSWLAYAVEKLDELVLLGRLFTEEGLDARAQEAWERNRTANASRRSSTRIHDPRVTERMKQIETLAHKRTPFDRRIAAQHERFGYPELATTTIGSFPQTEDVRRLRRDYRRGVIDDRAYREAIKAKIREAIAWQESIGLDVLVHGEFERGDMVEYFGEQLSGVAFSRNGWVQSYGTRCVKPPLIYGDVSRPEPMTVDWITYAQSLTSKPVKGMLTGAVTILNWSFVRDDQPRARTAYQIALAIRDEIDDLQQAGIGMIQVDEAAFKEGYPLRRAKREAYEAFALKSFWISTSVARDDTQIHTHMCYSYFNDIIGTIEDLDADVISIETARSGNALLHVFRQKGYAQEIGPGVYDIHSPRIPRVEEIVEQIRALLEVLPARQLWINPDCGLKTRRWEEVKPSLTHMVEAVRLVRKSLV